MSLTALTLLLACTPPKEPDGFGGTTAGGDDASTSDTSTSDGYIGGGGDGGGGNGSDVTLEDRTYVRDCEPERASEPPEAASDFPSGMEVNVFQRPGTECYAGSWVFEAGPGFNTTENYADEVTLQVWDSRDGWLLSEHAMTTEDNWTWRLSLPEEDAGAECGTTGLSFLAVPTLEGQQGRPAGLYVLDGEHSFTGGYGQRSYTDNVSYSVYTQDELEPDASWLYLLYPQSGATAGPFLLERIAEDIYGWEYEVDFEALGLPSPAGEVPNAILSVCKDEIILGTLSL